MKSKFLTKPQFEAIAKEAFAGIPKNDKPDKPMRRQYWCQLVDMYMKDRQLSEWQAANWTVPNWVAGGYQ